MVTEVGYRVKNLKGRFDYYQSLWVVREVFTNYDKKVKKHLVVIFQMLVLESRNVASSINENHEVTTEKFDYKEPTNISNTKHLTGTPLYPRHHKLIPKFINHNFYFLTGSSIEKNPWFLFREAIYGSIVINILLSMHIKLS